MPQTPVHPATEHEWLIEALNLQATIEDMEAPALVVHTTSEGLDLAKTTGRVAPGMAAMWADKAQELLAGLSAQVQTDPEARGTEWQGVAAIGAAVTQLLKQPKVGGSAVLDAEKQLAGLPQAQSDARSAIQRRLAAAAQPSRDLAEAHRKPDPHAKGIEWDAVRRACDAVDTALPAGQLTQAAVTKGELEAAKIAGLVQAAQQAIQGRLVIEAKALLDQLPALEAPDPEARGPEWAQVIAGAQAVRSALPDKNLHGSHVDAAREALDKIAPARVLALAAIQTRLKAAARDARDLADLHRKPDPEAEGTEWAEVGAACQAVDGALPDKLTQALVVQAKAEAAKLPGLVEKALKAIQTRLSLLAKPIRDDLAEHEKNDVGAEGGEWNAVTAAAEAVHRALPESALCKGDIQTAQGLLAQLVTARQKALAAMQPRMIAARKAIKERIDLHRPVQGDAKPGEWARVIAACDAAEKALPPLGGDPLTAPLLAPADTRERVMPVLIRSVQQTVALRLAREAAALIGQLAAFDPPLAGDESAWDPIHAECEAIRKVLSAKKLSAKVVADNKLRVEALPARCDALCARLWEGAVNAFKKDSAALAQGLKSTDTRTKGLVAAVKEDPTSARLDVLYTTKPTTHAEYRKLRAELALLKQPRFDRIQALVKEMTAKGFKEDAPEADVKAALQAADHRIVAKARHDQLFSLARLELARLQAAVFEAGGVKKVEQPPTPQPKKGGPQAKGGKAAQGTADTRADAGKAHGFRKDVAAADKALSAIARELQNKYDGLKRELERQWPISGIVIKLLDTKAPFGAEQRTEAFELFDFWQKALDGSATTRESQMSALDQQLADYGGGAAAAAPVFDQLEALRDAVTDGLLSKMAVEIEQNLSKKGLPAAAWKRALAEALAAQKATNAATDWKVWATRFKMSTTGGTGNSWGINNTGVVTATYYHETGKSEEKKVQSHLTLFELVAPKPNATAKQIVESVIGTGTGGIHASAEIYGSDDTKDKLGRKNPKVYRGDTRYLQNQPDGLEDELQTILDDYIATLEPIAQNWLDHGISPGQSKGNAAYLAEIEKRIAKLA